MKNPYADIAPEYYNKSLHPTCEYFGQCSSFSISRYLQALDPNSFWLEVGAGRSQILWPSNVYAIITDLNFGMLSGRNNRSHATLVCNASQLPFKDSAASGLVGSLADPYNDHSWWSEAQRVLMDGGDLIFTVPSYTWATRFRTKHELMKAEFLSVTGRVHSLPSLIYEKQSQISKLAKHGFEFVYYSGVEKVGETPPKVEVLSGKEPVLDLYHFRKR